LTPGIGEVVEPLFTQRAHKFSKEDETSTPYVYEVTMDANAVEGGFNLTESIYSRVPGGGQQVPAIVSEGANGRTRRDVSAPLPTGYLRESVNSDHEHRNASIKVAMTATADVGRLLIDRINDEEAGKLIQPYVFIQATRQNWTGHINIDPGAQEISGSNSERQDYALGPSRAPDFRGYFASRFSRPFSAYGVTQGAGVYSYTRSIYGQYVGGYVKFESDGQVEVRTGLSFVSVEQARRNLDLETSCSFEETVEQAKARWLDKLGRVEIEGVNQTSKAYDQKTFFYTAMFHALKYPNDFSEPLDETGLNRTFYDGYTDSIHVGSDNYYQSWSTWDTFRAEHSFITPFAPERVNGMMCSLVKIFELSGRLPMWQNVIETNIMIATHVDAVIANALTRGFKDFDIATAWEGVKKNAFVPPVRELELLYYDREPYTPFEVRAGLSTYMSKGWVANDRWSESASRTLDYAFDDYAASIVAEYAGDDLASHLRNRSQNYRAIYNDLTTFMEARNDNGTWAGSEQGWAEGDEWIYTFSVMHDVEGLAALLGGREKMKEKLDAYFNGRHNQQTNEPSHHAPYLYSAIGYPTLTQNLTRAIAFDNYNATSYGLGGGDDLGQMSWW
jgi:predicted alpha-1,2-mannosidase